MVRHQIATGLVAGRSVLPPYAALTDKGGRTPGDNGGHDGGWPPTDADGVGGARMTLRHCLVLAVVVAAFAPVCLVVFADGHAASQPWSPPPAGARAPAVDAVTSSDTKGSIGGGCVDRPLSYGLTNDQALGEQYARSLLDPFVSHPPLPRAGYYPPGRAPDQAALVHALYHGYVVVRYRPALADVVKHDLRGAVRRAAQPVVLVSGRGMPFAAGALVYGRESICGRMNRTTLGQLTVWVENARPLQPRR